MGLILLFIAINEKPNKLATLLTIHVSTTYPTLHSPVLKFTESCFKFDIQKTKLLFQNRLQALKKPYLFPQF